MTVKNTAAPSSIRSYQFFLDAVLPAGPYVVGSPIEFIDQLDGTNFLSHSIMFSNDGGVDLWFSFDGVNDHGRIKASETLQQDYRRAKKIWLRCVAPVAYRFWAW